VECVMVPGCEERAPKDRAWASWQGKPVPVTAPADEADIGDPAEAGANR
jgi:hypothetical protein